ncbi:MAG: M15 family metallopeptidase [Firmicutes bacterium]|nr:M15 family metallopeptidase [Bacillota bacterium]
MDLDVTVLVNKEHILDKDYVPLEMYVVDENENNFHQFKDASLKPMLRSDIKEYVDKLINDAQGLGLPIIVDSGYRSYNYQQVVLDALIKEKGDEAFKLVALPGASEHQTGLAIDFAYYENGIYNDDVKENDKEAIWLKNNAWKYGFILRYPKGKENVTGYNFEPWHFRFVGLKLAKYLFKNDLTLEEYYKNSNITL